MNQKPKPGKVNSWMWALSWKMFSIVSEVDELQGEKCSYNLDVISWLLPSQLDGSMAEGHIKEGQRSCWPDLWELLETKYPLLRDRMGPHTLPWFCYPGIWQRGLHTPPWHQLGSAGSADGSSQRWWALWDVTKIKYGSPYCVYNPLNGSSWNRTTCTPTAAGGAWKSGMSRYYPQKSAVC